MENVYNLLNKNKFIQRPLISDESLCYPRIWNCANPECLWNGENPCSFFDFNQQEVVARDPIPYPICPLCQGHNFYIHE